MKEQINVLAPSISFSGCNESRSKRKLVNKICFHKDSKFEEVDQGHPFMRVTHDIAIEEVIDVLEERWELITPRIVLMVVSNAGPLLEWRNTKQLDKFSKGLIKAANTTSMWIVTTGLNIGINQVIGEARAVELKKRESLKCHKHGLHHNRSKISRQPLVLIGLTAEHMVSKIHAIIADAEEPVQIINEGNNVNEHLFDLNSDHSHFIIVKDNTMNKTGLNHFASQLQKTILDGDVSSTTKLSHEITERAIGISEQPIATVAVPVVSVLINGGYESAKLILDNVKKETAVLVIRGSGGLADLLAFAYLTIYESGTRKWDPEYVENYIKPELSIKIAKHFTVLKDNHLMRNVFRERIVECVRVSEKDGQSFLTILNMHSSSSDMEDMGEHILRAVFKSQPRKDDWESQMQKDLILSLDWNNAQIATTEVFKKDPGSSLKINKLVFELALLQPDREEFVDLFLKQGFSLHNYLTPECFKKLFFKSRNEFFQSVCWEGVLGYSYSVPKPNKYFLETEVNFLIEELSDIPNFVKKEEMGRNAIGLFVRDATAAERSSLALLSIWAVLTDRPKLAKLIWKHFDQPVHLALIVSMMYKRLSYYINDSTLFKTMEVRSEEFANLAIAVLDAGFQESGCRAREIISGRISDWGHKTAVDIAASADNRAFLSHYCCQKWLTTVFLGQLRLRDLPWGAFTFPEWLKVILCATLIFPIYIWAFFVKDELYDMNDQDHEELDPEYLFASHHDILAGYEQMANPESRSRNAKLLEEYGNTHSVSADSKTKLLPRRREMFVHNCSLPLWKMVFLVWSAPITKFWMFQLSYMIFLGLFSLAVLWPSCGNWYLDTSVCFWIMLLVLENVRKIFVLHKKFANSVPLLSKIFEAFLIFSFAIFYLLCRIIYPNSLVDTYSCKVILCIVLLYFYFRFIVIYLPISPTLGPLLYRIKLMILQDFVNFMRMAALVIASGGIAIHVALYPDYPLTLELFRRIFHRAWFSMFLTPVHDLEPEASKNCPRRNLTDICRAGNFDDYHCPNTGIWPYIFTVQYFLLLKLILITLLMALFSSTASKLITESDAIWKYQRYRLIMDFDSRLRLPAPLSIFSFLGIGVEFVYKILSRLFCRNWKKVLQFYEAEKDYSFWKMLAEEHSETMASKENEAQRIETILEKLTTMADDIEYLKTTGRLLKVRGRNLERVNSNVVTQLELLKNTIEKSADLRLTLHTLARTSPYPSTKVQRYPVPDKFVPWEVTWVEYDPVTYTKTDNPTGIFDEDILSILEFRAENSLIPIYHWNSVSKEGSVDRQSWISDEIGQPVVYKLDRLVPQNPMGRTGLRGRGDLPRWGPNHHVYLVITRWHKIGDHVLEVVVDRSTESRNKFDLPGTPVYDDKRCDAVGKIFIRNKVDSVWQSNKDIETFFQLCGSPNLSTEEAESVNCYVVLRGYMDDPYNTDNAWREVELWNIHYPGNDHLSQHLGKSLSWRVITEDFFTKLPSSQGQLLSQTISQLKPTVF